MGTNQKIKDLEALTKQIEVEKNFDKITSDFAKAATLVKEILAETKEIKGRVLEIIRDVDGVVEKELCLDTRDGDDEE